MRRGEPPRCAVHGLPEWVDMTSTNNVFPFFAVYFNRLLRTSTSVSFCCTCSHSTSSLAICVVTSIPGGTSTAIGDFCAV